MIEERDIIAALGTALGEAAIGIVRLSGSGSVGLVAPFFKPHKKGLDLLTVQSHILNLGYICDENGEVIDEVLLAVMWSPRTYTREDVVEIYCHGGVLSVKSVLDLVLRNGARLAEPGEFTKRAFLNGRIDLAQAEAVLDIIKANSSKSAKIACRQLSGSVSDGIIEMRNLIKHLLAGIEAEIDFPEDVDPISPSERREKIDTLIKMVEEYLVGARVGRVYREGLQTVLLGKPNVGKSTLLNTMIGEERALVTEIPGTTRDIIEEVVVLDGIPLKLIDTAGIRENADIVESMGISRAKDALAGADIVLALFDVSEEFSDEDQMILDLIKDKKGVVLLNKIDLNIRKMDVEKIKRQLGDNFLALEISASKGWGRRELGEAILSIVGAGQVVPESMMLSRKRHQMVLEKVHGCLEEAKKSIEGCWPLECIAVDLWEAWLSLGEILGETVSEEVIDAIFEEFCIGK